MHNQVINSLEKEMVLILADAYSFAASKHQFQRRKGADKIPYINHPIEVIQLLVTCANPLSLELLVAGILHDTLEDTDATRPEIEELFGQKVLEIVLEVTDDMNLPAPIRKQKQIDTAAKLSAEARCIKIADKTCNIRDILYTRLKWTRKRKIAYVEWAIQVIHQLRGNFPGLEQQFDAAVEEARLVLKHNFVNPTEIPGY